MIMFTYKNKPNQSSDFYHNKVIKFWKVKVNGQGQWGNYALY